VRTCGALCKATVYVRTFARARARMRLCAACAVRRLTSCARSGGQVAARLCAALCCVVVSAGCAYICNCVRAWRACAWRATRAAARRDRVEEPSGWPPQGAPARGWRKVSPEGSGWWADSAVASFGKFETDSVFRRSPSRGGGYGGGEN
jgi:hypothetical protein